MSGPQRRIIPSEELTEFQRWQFNSLLDTPQRAAPAIDLPQPEESELIQVVQQEQAVAVESEVISEEPVIEEALNPAMAYPTAEEIEAISQQAHDEGYQAGLEQGRMQAELELQQLRPLLAQITETCLHTEGALADAVLELALLVAQQMVGDELRQHPKQLLAPIREALSAIPTATNPSKLFLSPADLQLLQQDLHYELADDVWRLVADEQLSTGSCRIETPNTQLEFSLASRWKKITGVLAVKSVPEFSLDQYGDGVLLGAEPALNSTLNSIDPVATPLSSDHDADA